jgi:pimeloyl-ACP methyl ester carboxylesterase
MAKVRMRDMVVLLPGITGSVLQKDGKDLWAISGQAAWGILTGLGSSFQQLKLVGDDPDVDDLGDGITATRLIPDAHLVPGLVKIDGYSAISRFISDNFAVIRGSIDDNKPANFFEFPYDWRRDNRVSARLLKRLIDQRLPQWRAHSGAADAKVILLAHSMGGLVSRYYLEVLEGWRDCKALITFGTPYRGSANALNYLVNGYKQLFIDLTDVMRSLTSVYQLLPIYKMVKAAGEYQRVAETTSIPGVEKRRAEQALAFHREIEAAVNTHVNVAQYREEGYRTVPMVGTRQPTFQSAELSGGRLTVSRDLPTGIDELLGDGDGTVPYLSAIPIEISDEYRDSFVAERHGSLQNNSQVLKDLFNRLKQMQVKNLGSIRGALTSPEAAERAAISLDLDDLYLAGESVTLRAKLVNLSRDPGALKARIEPVAAVGITVESELRQTNDGWVLVINTLPQGLYRVEVRTRRSGPQAPTPVHDLFEVVR